jgi:ATP-dependent Lon protease
MEAGVRELERKIASLCRRVASAVIGYDKEKSEGIVDENNNPVKITPAEVKRLLGASIYHREKAPKPIAGTALGLAWTGCGGTVLPIECISLPGGKGELKLTGSLGKVMQESAAAAFSLVRSRAAQWQVAEDYFSTRDFHIHVPDGATPKDGPSAGITIVSALASLLKNQPLAAGTAMTGEINLSGKVTAIGGLREKSVAALRAGVKRIIVPAENREEYLEIPEEIRNKLTVHFVSDIDEVLAVIFSPLKKK